MITQIVTLLGVLIGALTSYVSTTVAERTRHRRTMATRWDERKLNTYVEYLTCVKEAADSAKESLKARGNPDLQRALLATMNEAEKRRSVLFETLILLAEPSAVEAAKDVNQILWQALIAARESNCDRFFWVDDLMAALNAFHESARRDLGLFKPDLDAVA
ncbi:hypothetical protein HXP44_24320 [Streptomyces sioyaensis]|uniref:Uncharacterized protein n=1 Tax=Streptomyces sioyaensis TaxID=67364 RepID=A0A4Q1QY33_9ACTN|nr:hypothetical protein [Streptomyces sioyaensis]MBM4795097.1 hypothetical protein [Streptomyces sioyaensis]RXS64098.1 hypothetical protein EST54_23365 [Streptomyces sioyaensis]